MKAFVITITDLPESVECAHRLIKSADIKSNLSVEIFSAFTPKDKPAEILYRKDIRLDKFKDDIGSRPQNVIAAFCSHYSLWEQCAAGNEDFVIFEHDAVVVNEIPRYMPHTGCVSLGAPSYGKWKTPTTLGVGPLTSKMYFPGAHAYRLHPKAAQDFCEMAALNATATDVFINLQNFPWLQEYFPWPVICKDNFTTIQNPTGCYAKHNWNQGYNIVKVK